MTTEELLTLCDRLEKDHACCPGLQHIWNANGGCQWCHQDRDDVDAAIIATALRERLAGPEWTKEPPKVEGFYWVKSPRIAEQVTNAFTFGSRHELVANVHGYPQLRNVSQFDGAEWLGPITPERLAGPDVRDLRARADALAAVLDALVTDCERSREMVFDNADDAYGSKVSMENARKALTDYRN